VQVAVDLSAEGSHGRRGSARPVPAVPTAPTVPTGTARYVAGRRTAAIIELYSRLWQALEELAVAFGRFGPADPEVERRLLVLRLELVVLLDTFESARCRSQLNPEQRAELHGTVQRQLEALSVQPEAGGGPALARPQNELLDAVLKLL